MIRSAIGATAWLISAGSAAGQQAPWATPNQQVSHRDRVYAAEQFSNTVSVVDPVDNALLGVIRLGDPQPGNLSPLYRGQVLVHGMNYSPDGRTLAVVSIASNSVTFIDTATNGIRHVTYVGRSPHEPFFTPDGKEVWITVRGEDYVSILDTANFEEKARIKTPGGPGMTVFSPDGRYGYVCSSFNPEVTIFDVASRTVVGRVAQPSPFCPNIAATPDGQQVWFTLKDVGKTVVFGARPPFAILKVLDTGPITNHVNFARTPAGLFAYVTVGGLDQVKVFRTNDFSLVATVAVGKLPHGVWPAGDGSRVYIGLENADALAAIDTRTHRVIGTVAIGQAPQAVVYVPNAVPTGGGRAGLQPLGVAGGDTQIEMRAVDAAGPPRTSVSLFDQGLTQILQAAVTGLAPHQAFLLALSRSADGSGPIEPLSRFTTNAAGAAIVNAVGPIRQIVTDPAIPDERRFLVITDEAGERAVQVQSGKVTATGEH